MNKYVVSNEVYKERLAICKGCEYYFSPTGQCKRCLCFMRLKCRISTLKCPENKWDRVVAIKPPDDLSEEQITEIIAVWENIKTGRAKNVEAKRNMIEIYNIIYGTNFDRNTNCGSCLQSCFEGIKNLYNKYGG
jgi:hypothetical protein|tara:strand:+ start:1695 stop:2096 length:402 start_codon:yes stop_codon:yes gene_type:complete